MGIFYREIRMDRACSATVGTARSRRQLHASARPHNVYLSKNTVLHTIKYGCQESDLEAVPALDEKLRHENFDGKMFFDH